MPKNDDSVPRPCFGCGRETPSSPTETAAPLCADCNATAIQETSLLSPADREIASGFPPASESRFTQGDLLADRFLVAKYLGSGGAGEVFKAQDKVLGDWVALKVVFPDQVRSAPGRLRLLREVQLARRVTHNNVCRIFDLVQHRDRGELVYLVSMELLDGETLRDRCSREPPLALAEVLPIVRQIARGLNAAHRLGIVHRDLKPSNVMLVKEEGGLRVAITDFGLAHSIDRKAQLEQTLTHQGEVLGTPAYMAPEQASSEPTSFATDLYALGVILYEIFAGKLPFSSKNVWQMVAERLTEDPVPLRNFRPDLRPELLDLVDRCLQRDPAQRPESAREVLDTLDFGDGKWDFFGQKFYDAQSTTAHNATAQKATAQKAAAQKAEMPPGGAQTTEVNSANSRRISPIVPTVANQAPAPAPPSSPDQPQHEPRRMPVLLAIAACASVLGVFFIFWAIGLDKSFGSQRHEDASPLETDLNERKAVDAILAEIPPMDFSTGRGNPAASSQEGSDTYASNALEAANKNLSAYQAEPAIQILKAALNTRPADPRLLAALAEALWRGGYEKEARQIIDQALELSGDLPREQRLVIEGIHQGLHGDWHGARNIFEGLWLAKHQPLENGLRAIEASWLSGRVDPMGELFQELRNLAKGRAEEPRIDLWQSRLAEATGDFESQKSLAQRVLETSRRKNYPGLVIEGLLSLASAQRGLGSQQEYRESIDSLEQAARESNSPFYQAHALRSKAIMLNWFGREDEALGPLERADSLFADIGSTQGRCQTLHEFGRLGNLGEVRPLEHLKRGIEVCAAGGFNAEEAIARWHLARAYRDRGDFARSATLFRDVLNQLEELENHRLIAETRVSLAYLLGRMGRVNEAIKVLEAAEAWFQQNPNQNRLTRVLIASAEAAMHSGRVDQASVLLEQARALEPAGWQLLNLYSTICKLHYVRGEARHLRREAANLADFARSLAAQDYIYQAHTYDALSLELEGRIEQSIEKLEAIAPNGNAASLAMLLIRQGKFKAAADITAVILEDRQQASQWLGRIFSAEIDAGKDLERSQELLKTVEQEADMYGHVMVAAVARTTRGRISRDTALLRQVRDEARGNGLLRIASVAENNSMQLQP